VELRETLGEDDFEAAWAAGAAVSPLDLVSLMPEIDVDSAGVFS
jgi:hypothetical protein